MLDSSRSFVKGSIRAANPLEEKRSGHWLVEAEPRWGRLRIPPACGVPSHWECLFKTYGHACAIHKEYRHIYSFPTIYRVLRTSWLYSGAPVPIRRATVVTAHPDFWQFEGKNLPYNSSLYRFAVESGPFTHGPSEEIFYPYPQPNPLALNGKRQCCVSISIFMQMEMYLASASFVCFADSR